MAAGLGFKDFTTGEVLTAADVDGYLMQGIWVFASAAARDAAVTSPQEGNACYLKDTDVIQVYTGSAWAAQSASNPISANIVDAKGDLIVGTAADTVSRLAVGTNGYTLVADSAAATGLKWAAPASGATFVGCILDNTTDITISSATSTLLTYDTETADTNAFHSTTSDTGRITIPSGYAGKYFFIGSIESSVYNLSTNSGNTTVSLRKNGSSIANAFQGNLAGFNTKVCVTWTDVASVGDYYELYAYQNSGGTRTIYYNKLNLCQFAAYYLG